MKIEITILGLLMEQNLYGYEIKKKIVERLGDYVDIKFGSIYYAIKKAVDNEWVERVGTEKEGGNPERYIYQILPSGKKYYKKILKQYLDHNYIHFDIDIVLMFYNTLTKDQKEHFVEERIEYIQKKISEITKKMQKEKENSSPFSQYNVYSYLDYHMRAELNWIEELKAQGFTESTHADDN